MNDYPYEAIVFLGDKDEIVKYTGDEVVRCKDCKYAKYDKYIDRYDCHVWSADHDQYTEANDFCSSTTNHPCVFAVAREECCIHIIAYMVAGGNWPTNSG